MRDDGELQFPQTGEAKVRVVGDDEDDEDIGNRVENTLYETKWPISTSEKWIYPFTNNLIVTGSDKFFNKKILLKYN